MADSETNEGIHDKMPEKRQWFVTTCWTNLAAAQKEGSPEAKEALESLCQSYWYPLYAYLRWQGNSDADAKDLVQGFFYQVLEKNFLGALDKKKGKFRSFLLASIRHYASKQYAKEKAKKRGGGQQFVFLDQEDAEGRFAMEPATDDAPPEQVFAVRWAKSVLEHALASLREEQVAAGRQEIFDALERFLKEDVGTGGYDDVANELGLEKGTVSVTVHRLRQRYRDLVREEIQRTVAKPDEVDGEMEYLLKVLGRGGEL